MPRGGKTIMANFNTLVEDIHAYLDGTMAKEDFSIEGTSAANVIELAKGVATHTLDLLDHSPRNPRDPRETTVRMSEIGTPCLRQLWYKWFRPDLGLPPFAENGNPTLPLKFLYGDYLEELVLFLAKEAGHKVACRQKEVTYEPIKYPVRAVGHLDAMIDGYVVDVKSAADVSFQKYKREGLTADNDTFGYRYQIDSYAKAIGTTCRAFIFINKHDGELLVIDRTSEPPVDVDERLRKIGDLTYMLTPPRDFEPAIDKMGLGMKLPTVCSYCAFKYTCYPDLKGYVISGRPVYFAELTPKGTKYVADKTKIPTPKAFEIGEEIEIRGKGGSPVEDEGPPF
jgi:hypothetical protein